ncbi:MAG: tyrosine-type recombinase/integrase [Clostridium sp.]|jgi:integrase|nr:tyrosine-type recombinase/integrase [Clostridium sp.]
MQTIQELAMRVPAEMTAAGYAQNTAWQLYIYSLLPLVRLHEAQSKTHFDTDLTADHIRELRARYYGGEISCRLYVQRIYGIEKITRLHETGKLLWETPRKGSMYKLNDCYGQLLDEYLGSASFHPNTRGDVVWAARSLFAWLVKENHDTLGDVAAPEIQAYMVPCSQSMTSSSIRNVQLYLRKLCAYLHERGLLGNPYASLLSVKSSHEAKLYPATPQEEIAAVLRQIDRSTVSGKRNYAMILLGAVTGLRAVDVKNLKLSDIDWANGEIAVVQSKTGKTNVLPLAEDVGEAARDHILHARPNTTSGNVFIRLAPPYVEMKDAVSIGCLYGTYRKKAGLTRKAFGGMGFHSLRRALGRNMITAGVPIEDAAQTMGDEKIDSMKKYIALDSEHLAECSLGFSGTELSGGAEE